MPRPIDRRSLTDQIKDALLDQITSGALKPGDRLVEMTIAKTMQTSQAPVREALQALHALGIVEMRRNRGAVVRAADAQELRDIYAVRAELEGHAIAVATIQTPELPATLLALCNQMDATDDPRSFVALNTAFHRAIVTACGNPVLLETWERLDIRARTAVNVSRAERSLEAARADHRDIVRLIAAGRPVAARKRLMRHITSVLETRDTP